MIAIICNTTTIIKMLFEKNKYIYLFLGFFVLYTFYLHVPLEKIIIDYKIIKYVGNNDNSDILC